MYKTYLTLMLLGLSLGLVEPAWTARQHSDAEEMQQLTEYYKQGRHRRDERIEFFPFGSSKRPVIISTPHGASRDAAANPRPVLVVLDGMIEEAASLGALFDLSPILIGIPSDNRVRDFIGPRPESGDWSDPKGRDIVPDPEPFIRFLAKTISPYIDQHYPNAPVKILAGYSFGGIATIHTLMRYPEAFDAYLAGSPSLWYNTQFYHDLAKEAAQQPGAFKRKCLVLTAAEDEAGILTNTRSFERLLTQLDLPLHIYFQRNLHQDHYHHLLSSLDFGWEVIFQLDDSFPLQVLADHNRSEVEKRIRHFEEMHSCVRYSPAMLSTVWMAWGSQLVKEKRYDEAKALYLRLLNELPAAAKARMLIEFPGKRFKELPDDFKSLVAEQYWPLYTLAQTLRPPFAVHYRNMDIVDYLNEHGL